MIEATVYDLATGRIVSCIIVREDEIAANVREGMACVPGRFHPDAFYVKDGQPKPYPARPGAWVTFDLEAEGWIDARWPEQAAADRREAKAAAVTRVNEWAGKERGKHVTQIPGQDMIYLAKEAEALRYLAETPEPADLSSYPLIAAEVGITAPDAYQIAQIWAQLGAMWRQVAARIEGARLGAINAITAAEDDAAIRSAIAFTEQT